jgi:hypothetical protein
MDIDSDLIHIAFDNLFHEFHCDPERNEVWGPDYWSIFGFTIEDNEIKIVDEQKFIIFLLEWS